MTLELIIYITIVAVTLIVTYFTILDWYAKDFVYGEIQDTYPDGDSSRKVKTKL